jgi:hypothetical protein
MRATRGAFLMTTPRVSGSHVRGVILMTTPRWWTLRFSGAWWQPVPWWCRLPGTCDRLALMTPRLYKPLFTSYFHLYSRTLAFALGEALLYLLYFSSFQPKPPKISFDSESGTPTKTMVIPSSKQSRFIPRELFWLSRLVQLENCHAARLTTMDERI